MLGSEIHRIAREHEYALPPVGFTEARARIGGLNYQRVTYRCPADGCWYIVHCADRSIAERFESAHTQAQTSGRTLLGDVCPAPPRREAIPSALALVQRTWHEIDDALVALKSGATYRGMSDDKLRGYMLGLAFSIVAQEGHIFPDARSVAREAERRRRMHADEMPWEATPSRHNRNALVSEVTPWYPAPPGSAATSPTPPAGSKSPAARTPRTRSPRSGGMVHTRAAGVVPGSADGQADRIQVLKAAAASGILNTAQLAAMYGMTTAEVEAAINS